MRIALATLNGCDRATFVAALGPLFEGSPWVAEAGFEGRPFRDAHHLHQGLCAAMQRAGSERQLALMRAHPDLAGRFARQGQLTAESSREQAAAGLVSLAPEVIAELEALNATYRQRFGFPFILCARLNNLETVRSALRSRLESTPEAEHRNALAEIEKIAWLRLVDVLEPGATDETSEPAR